MQIDPPTFYKMGKLASIPDPILQKVSWIHVLRASNQVVDALAKLELDLHYSLCLFDVVLNFIANVLRVNLACIKFF